VSKGSESRALSRFVDAMREVLGLDPLYSDPRVRDIERFGWRTFRWGHRQGIHAGAVTPDD
jgi:hypothetical protein